MTLINVVNSLQWKDVFTESRMTLMALPGNEMKRPCSLETDCSLSGPVQWTGRKKRQEKFDIKAEKQNISQVLRLSPRGQSSFKRVIGFIRQLLNNDEPPQQWGSSEPKGLSFSCLILWLMVQLSSRSQLTIFQGWVHLAENLMARVAPFIF